MTLCLRRALVVCLALLVLRSPAQNPAQGPRPRLVGYFLQGGLVSTPPYTVKTLVDSGGAALLDQLDYSQGFVHGGRCSIADPNADLNYTFAAAESVDGKADLPAQPFRGNFRQLAELKRRFPHLKVLISLEGRASDFADDAQPAKRDAFVDSCVDLFLKGNYAPGLSVPGLFDGIDVDWEYPHGGDNAANFLALLTSFRQRMDAFRPGLLLTIAVGGRQAYDGLDLAAVNRVVDQIGLMTYDFAGPWSRVTGFNAPLRAGEHRIGNVEDFVRAWRAAGVPDEKLLLGLPFYGYGWRRVEEANNGLFQEGEPIRGDHSFRDIERLAAESTVFRDDPSQAPWLFDGDAFWTYEDPVSIHRKADFVRGQHLGGLMIWQLGDDNADALLLHAAASAIAEPADPTSAHLTTLATKASVPTPVR